ncbi:MAG: 4-(cytidine 5'-diphospho)-2-C-methyl-D-erythritol kinase [Planctomycetes bacterium]|nr:4-(cytidine 5'-diphospho)-2-C-methyl-D-erythritol kinase [Planctomycetota bacterium]
MLCRGPNPNVTLFAPAKLNLFLKVLGKRGDGYHELETLMVSLALYDTLRFHITPSPRLTLSCRDAASCRVGGPVREMPGVGDDNLVLRAARLLQETTGTQYGTHIELFKRIPMAAGLAGGSSDAAATLVGLNRLWNLGYSNNELMSLAARLGSDIPFFLASATAAVCRGRGEIVEPCSIPGPLWFVVARPGTGLSTAEVFRHCRPGSVPWSVDDLVTRLQTGRHSTAQKLFYNSLQEPAEQLNPDVTRLRRAFARQPFLGHQMSGSGTSYFGWCRSRRQATQCAARLAAARLGDVFIVSNRP